METKYLRLLGMAWYDSIKITSYTLYCLGMHTKVVKLYLKKKKHWSGYHKVKISTTSIGEGVGCDWEEMVGVFWKAGHDGLFLDHGPGNMGVNCKFYKLSKRDR